MSAPFWTNPSVLALAAEGDPMTVIVERARALVLKAMDAGWSGPPFDPFELAELHQIPVVAHEDLRDARLTAAMDGTPQIEYNPTRPRGRLRFNIAHELAHTLFPDYADFARYRAGEKHRADEWQLELLCDVAAAELLMPLGSFAELANEPPRIEHLMELRRQYDVSTEALLLRVIKLTPEAAAVFAASRMDGNDVDSDFRIDYVANSRSGWDAGLRRGSRVAVSSVLGDCTAVGYTARGHDGIGGNDPMVVECVGVPPYPGQSLPRVIGLLRPLTPEHAGPELVELFGDACQPRGEPPFLIAHLVNDRTPNWGGAFTKSLKHRYPEAQRDFRDWVAEDRRNLRLGKVRITDIDHSVAIATMVAQRGFGPPTGTPRVRYSALRACLIEVADVARKRGASVHMPRVGTGGGGGDWRIIRELIDETLVQQGIPVVVYGRPETKPPLPAQQMLSFE